MKNGLRKMLRPNKFDDVGGVLVMGFYVLVNKKNNSIITTSVDFDDVWQMLIEIKKEHPSIDYHIYKSKVGC